VLSIGKLTAGQQAYYQAQVAQGRDDYYSGRGEAPGQWTGRLAAELGLEGRVTSEAFDALLLHGRHPLSGEALRPASRITAYDFTFSAPKSVSVLYAIAGEETSEGLREAHDEAVAAAMDYLEREAISARRGKGGRERVEASGVVGGAYRHRMSRERDPQLHTHVVTANLSRGVDGKWGALHAYPAYQHAKAAGCAYEAHLRWAIHERLPWVEWGPVKNGIAEIVSVPEEVLVEFSRRRQQILEWVAEHGAADAGLRLENAVLATRPRKPEEIDTPSWRADARARAQEHGFGRDELAALAGRDVDQEQAAITDGVAARRSHVEHGQAGLDAQLAGELAGPYGLTRMRNTFAVRHAMAEVAGAARQGASVAEVEARTERVLRDPGMLFVADDRERRYTTVDLRDHEALIVEGAERRRGAGIARVDEHVVARALEGWPVRLNDGQRAVLARLTSSGHGFEHVEALAGTGKTTLLGAVAECYRAQGFQVVGVAKTARAVRELKERAGIPRSWTGAQLLGSMDRYGGGFGPAPTVLLFDEAAMCETREATRILAQAEADRVKVIAVGDSGQLPAVEAGGWFGALTRRLGALELTEVMRQRDAQEREALAKVRSADPQPYLALKRERGELVTHASVEAAEDAAVHAWQRARETAGTAQVVMVARDNARRARLNQTARGLLAAEGELAGPAVTIGGREFAVGDRVIARRNDRLRDVDNGMRGTVVAVDAAAAVVTIEADAGGRRQLDRGYVEEHLEHAYALTGHGTQGGTLERTVVVGRPEEFSLNWGYTALSRAREQTEVYLVAERRPPPGREELAPGEDLSRSREQAIAVMAASLRRPDVEDLAIEQLAAAETGGEVELDDRTPVAQPMAQEAAADRLEADAAREPAHARDVADDARPVERETVRVPDPLEAQRRALGPNRAGRLPEPTSTGRGWLAGRSEEELAALCAEHAAAVERLDVAGALEAARLQAAWAAAAESREAAHARLAELRAQRDALGPLRRRERRDLDQAIATQQRVVDRSAQELQRFEREEQALRTAGRHPDAWLERDGHDAVTWAEASRERAIRRELAAREAEQRAVSDPPAHVLDALGARPDAAADRARWDQLARALERHRITHDVDVAREGALGTEPTAARPGRQDTREEGLDRFRRDRRDLAERVQAFRADRGLEHLAAELGREIDSPGPEGGFEL
jgi:conjugative relaxase-like TrwC/TraI family protein